MKKRFDLLMGSLLIGSMLVFSHTLVPLTVGIDDPTTVIPPLGKGPGQVPNLWQEGYQLQFETDHPVYTFTLLDETDSVVFTTVVSTTVTSIMLPSYLTGTYKILLEEAGCNYYFYGYIVL